MHYYYDPYNPSAPWQSYPTPPPSDNPDDFGYHSAFHHAFIQVLSYLCILAIVILVVGIVSILFGSCTTPRTIEQHHHHHYEADTIAIQQQIDARLTSWQSHIDSTYHQLFTSFSTELFNSSQEKEITTETITTATDSLGRTLRTEQRRTERTLSQRQQQTELRLTQEYESRLQTAIATQDSIWQLRFDALQTHVAQTDSTTNIKTPTTNLTSWQNFRLWLANILLILIGIALVIWLITKRASWLPLFKRN